MGGMGRRKGPLSSFFWLYVGVSIFGAVVITLDNLFINGLTFQSLLDYNLKAIGLQIIGLLLLFQGYSFIRLRVVQRFLRGEPLDGIQVKKRLLQFPSDMFWAMVLFGLTTSPLYHHKEILAFSMPDLIRFIKSFCFEFSVILLLAVLLYTFLRRKIRPILLQLTDINTDQVRPTTILTPFLITFMSLMLIMMLSLCFYILKTVQTATPVDLTVLFSIGGFNLLVGMFLFILILSEFRRDLRKIIDKIHFLSKGSRKGLQGTIPILFHDEVGQLGARFNGLQKRVADTYSDLEKELELASKVQQALLPPTQQRIHHVEIAAFCLPAKEVGGDFFDIIVLDDHRFAVIIGDITGKGLPAALVMSAMLLLVRTEIRRGGSAGDILTRLNSLVLETVNEEMYLTIGLAIFDHRQYTCQYSSAGHVSPYRLLPKGLEPVTHPSIPLGLVAGEVYEDVTFDLQRGERIVFYTDGMVERVNDRGEWIGFEGFERNLLKMDRTLSGEDQLDWLKRQTLSHNGNPDDDDDTTVVLIQF